MHFTEYHLLNFNDTSVEMKIANFASQIINPLKKDGQIYLTAHDIYLVCGTGRLNAALRSCLIKAGGTNGRKMVDGKPQGCLWKLNEGNWTLLLETWAAYAALRKKTREVRDPVTKELIEARVSSTDSAGIQH